MKKIVLLILILSPCCFLFGQISSNIAIVPTGETFFAFGINNRFKVFARQAVPITIDKIKARLVEGYDSKTYAPIYGEEELTLEALGYNEFKLLSFTTHGVVEFEIELESGKETVMQELIPIPAKFYIKNHRLRRENWQKEDKKLTIHELREAEGIYGKMDYEGLNAGLHVLHFQVSAVIDGILQPEILNKGGRFNRETQALIQELQAGDMLILKYLTYKTNFLEVSIDPVIIELK